jgi:hypothetical protein
VTLRDLHNKNAEHDFEVLGHVVSNIGADASAWDEPIVGRSHQQATVVIPMFPEDVGASDDWRDRGNGQASSAVERLRPRLHPADDMQALPQPQAVVEGLLFTPGESVCYAPPKTAKTFWGIDLALSVATGRNFMGRVVQQAPVLYVIAEGVGGVGNRIEAWREYHQAGPIPDAWFLTSAVNLLDPTSVDALCVLAAEHRARFVVIDTLARCSAGMDENAAKDMSRVIESLDQIRDATGHVHAQHHTGKDTSRGMRGSNSLLGALDTAIELSGDTHALRVAVTDQKDAPVVEPWWCQLVPSENSAVLVPMRAGDVLTETDRKILAALEALPADHRTATKWQKAAEGEGIPASSFYQGIKRLQEQNQVIGGGKRGALYAIPGEEPLE